MRMRLFVGGTLLASLEVGHAFIAFQPTCEGPSQDDKFNYVLSPQVRGTMDIVWSCFAVMLLCTWSIQHLSVPDPRLTGTKRHKIHKEAEEEETTGKHPHSRRRRIALWMIRALAWVFRAKKKPHLWNEFLDESHWNFRRLEGMALCVLAPEYYLGKAFAENSSANASRGEFGDEHNWSTTHAFFADTRGFVLKFETTAVWTELIPSKKGSEEGRKRHHPYPGGDPTPYKPQSVDDAIEEELRVCRKEHGDCPFRVRVDEAESRTSDATGTSIEVQEHTLDVVSNGPLPSQEPDINEILLPLDTAHLPQPLDIASPALPDNFSVLTTAVASPGSQRHRQWLSLPTSRPTTPQGRQSKAQAAPKEEEQTHITVSSVPPDTPPPENQPPAPPEQSINSAKQPRERLLPHEMWSGEWALSALQMHEAKELKLIPEPPYIDIKTLKDHSKSDSLVKALALWQLLWLTIQVLARAATHLPITLLEITVLAFSALSMITYVLLWHKPQDVKTPTYIKALRPITRADVIALAACAPVSTMLVHDFWLHGVNVRAMGDSVFPWPRGVSLNLPRLPKKCQRPQSKGISIQMDAVFFGMGLGGAVFGGIHFAAWDFDFPTPVERLLWRISCGLIVGFPVLMSAIYLLYLKWADMDAENRHGDSWTNRVLRRFGHVTVPIYFLARLYLLVEVFRSLAYSPPGVFQTIGWPTMVPHYS